MKKKGRKVPKWQLDDVYNWEFPYGYTDPKDETWRLEELFKVKEDGTKDVNVYHEESGETLLYSACKQILFDSVELLLKLGADVNLKTIQVPRPFGITSNYVCNSCSSIIHHGISPLYMICAGRHIFDGRDDMPIRDKDGRQESEVEIAKLLIQAGSDVNAVTYAMNGEEKCNSHYGQTPLHAAAAASGQKDIVKLLLANGAEVDKTDPSGETAFHKASRSDQIVVMRLLIQRGADINKKDNEGNTPLLACCRMVRIRPIKYLITSNVNLNATNNNGENALLVVLKFKHYSRTTDNRSGAEKAANYLIEAGIDIHCRDNDGLTPVFLAITWRMVSTVALLISRGANFLGRDDEGRSPSSGFMEARFRAEEQIRIDRMISLHPWSRRRSLIVIRPHADHEVNKEHQLSALGHILIANKSGEANSHDALMFQLKRIVSKFL